MSSHSDSHPFLAAYQVRIQQIKTTLLLDLKGALKDESEDPTPSEAKTSRIQSILSLRSKLEAQ